MMELVHLQDETPEKLAPPTSSTDTLAPERFSRGAGVAGMGISVSAGA